MAPSGLNRADIVAKLERDPLRHIVLLKHLAAFPDATTVHHVTDGEASATLVLLAVAASAYDRRTYPSATFAALIASDRPDLTRAVLDVVPQHVGVVFKLSGDTDIDVVQSLFDVERTTIVISFTATSLFETDAAVRVTTRPSPAAFDLFAAQDHAQAWLEPLLAADRAFVCTLEQDNAPQSVCFAFENYKRVWEIGGVFTPKALRGHGFAQRVVRTVLAELSKRDLLPRYQVHAENIASVRLAESIGLTRFLTITHLLRRPGDA